MHAVMSDILAADRSLCLPSTAALPSAASVSFATVGPGQALRWNFLCGRGHAIEQGSNRAQPLPPRGLYPWDSGSPLDPQQPARLTAEAQLSPAKPCHVRLGLRAQKLTPVSRRA